MKYPKDAIFDATVLLETVCPSSVLIIGQTLFDIANEYQQQCQLIQKDCEITQIESTAKVSDSELSQRYDLAVIGEVLETQEQRQSEQLIGRLRDLCTPRLIVLADLNQSNWQENDLLGFGLNRYSSHAGFVLYQYNIDSYKKTPDWFNAKHWANPNLWNKFWW